MNLKRPVAMPAQPMAGLEQGISNRARSLLRICMDHQYRASKPQ
jgi:hypothetical protein